MDERHKQMIARLEAYARRDPSGYRARVIALAVVGYTYLLALMVGSVALSVGCVWLAISTGHFSLGALKLALALFLFGVFVFVSLWVRIPAPDGVEIARGQAPALFAAVDEITARLKCPSVDHILIDSNFNAGAAQIPRFGVFGGYRQYLLLGYPLLCALSPLHVLAIVGHEMGHLSARHGRMGIWLYRVQQTWATLLDGSWSRSEKRALDIDSLFTWFPPYFLAYSFALRRASEYEADKMAAEIAGADAASEALAATWVKGSYFEGTLMPSAMKLVNDYAWPPERVLVDVFESLAGPAPARVADRAVTSTLARVADYDDSHPAPRDRIAAMKGVPPESVSLPSSAASRAPDETAAARFLGLFANEIAQRLEAEFRTSAQASWAEQHAARREARNRLRDLDLKLATGQISPQEAAERVQIIGVLKDGEEALPALRDYSDSHPDDAVGRLLLGRALLEAGNRAGIDQIEAAMRLDADLTMHGCSLVYDFLCTTEGVEAAEPYRARAEKRCAETEEAVQERYTLSARDVLVAHDLAPDAVDAIRQLVASEPDAVAAYLVRKLTRTMPEKPFYVVGIEPRRFWMNHQQAHIGIGERLNGAAQLPVDAVFVVMRDRHGKLRRPITRVPGSEIYRRA